MVYKERIQFFSLKCQSILFSRQKKIKALEIKMRKNILPNTKCLRLLSLTFDHKLNWKEHKTYIKIESNSIEKT